MSDPDEKEPETPREEKRSHALDNATKSIVDVAVAVDGLVVLTREGLRRALLMIATCGMLLLVSTLTMLLTYLRVRAQTNRVEELAGRIEAIAVEQTKARQTAEKTQEKVDDAAKLAADKPTVEIVPSASGGRAQAVVVIRSPAKDRAATSASTGEPSTIELPLKLPEDAKLK